VLLEIGDEGFREFDVRLRLPFASTVDGVFLRWVKHVANVVHLTELSLSEGIVKGELVARCLESW
jgi:hypothetical protein